MADAAKNYCRACFTIAKEIINTSQIIQENKWKKLTNWINSLLLLPQVVEQNQVILLRLWKTYLLNMQFRLNKCILNISFLGIIQQQSGYQQCCVNYSYDLKIL
ncbi:unnamed protein product [Paramecium pentaurelia]|uniref:Uncharacterized protein n=1 Tax=Paramecium pentaurelia TaxID=43138 RepID=A0A8S1XN08_9CILI|nr:unnamed protein product [Paramecium pentaurelia]